MDLTCTFFQINAKIREAMFSAKRDGDVYTLNVEKDLTMVVENAMSGNKWDMWHTRTGHPNYTI